MINIDTNQIKRKMVKGNKTPKILKIIVQSNFEDPTKNNTSKKINEPKNSGSLI